MRSIFKSFISQPRRRTVHEICDGILVGLNDPKHFSEDLAHALSKLKKKRGGIPVHSILLVDTSPSPFMFELLDGRVPASPCHIGPYDSAPGLLTLFEICASIYEFVRQGAEENAHKVVLVVASSIVPEARPVASVAMVVSCFWTYTGRNRDAVDALEDFWRKAMMEGFLTESQVRLELEMRNAAQYLKYFTRVRQEGVLENRAPLKIIKVLVQGKVVLPSGKSWSPVLRIFSASKADEASEGTSAFQVANCRDESAVGEGYASFTPNIIAYGDVVFHFEHYSNTKRKPLRFFCAARHTAFLEPPVCRLGLKDVEFFPGRGDGAQFDKDFTVDIFLERFDAEEDGLKLNEEDVELLERVGEDIASIEELAEFAPDSMPPVFTKPGAYTGVTPSQMDVVNSEQHSTLLQELNQEFIGRKFARARMDEMDMDEDAGPHDAESRKIDVIQRMMEDVPDVDLKDFMDAFKNFKDEISEDSMSRDETKRMIMERAKTNRDLMNDSAFEAAVDAYIKDPSSLGFDEGLGSRSGTGGSRPGPGVDGGGGSGAASSEVEDDDMPLPPQDDGEELPVPPEDTEEEAPPPPPDDDEEQAAPPPPDSDEEAPPPPPEDDDVQAAAPPPDDLSDGEPPSEDPTFAPTEKMKPLMWHTIPAAKLKNSVFDGALDEKIQLDEDTAKELESMFTVNQTRTTDDEPVQQEVTAGILDSKRKMMLDITLSKFDASPKEICEAVCSFDPLKEVLSDENVETLVGIHFKEEEILAAKEFPGGEDDILKFSKAEQLPYFVSRIENWNAKVAVTMTLRDHEMAIQEVETSLTMLKETCKSVQDNEKLRMVIGAVLGVGNYLNSGTKRGNAKGFRLDVLLNLTTTKGKDKKTTLLSYIVSMLAAKCPELLSLPEDLSFLEGASKLSKADIEKEIATFGKAIKIMKRELNEYFKVKGAAQMRANSGTYEGGTDGLQRASSADGPNSTEFVLSRLESVEKARNSLLERLSSLSQNSPLDRAESPTSDAENPSVEERRMVSLQHTLLNCLKALENLYDMFDETSRVANDLIAYLGESPKKMTVDALLSNLFQFTVAFKSCRTDVLAENERKERAEARGRRDEPEGANAALEPTEEHLNENSPARDFKQVLNEKISHSSPAHKGIAAQASESSGNKTGPSQVEEVEPEFEEGFVPWRAASRVGEGFQRISFHDDDDKKENAT